MELDISLLNVRGIGEKTYNKFNKIGIEKVVDLMLYFPRTYDIITFLDDISLAKDKDMIVIKVKCEKINKPYKSNNKLISDIKFSNNDKNITARYYNMPYITNSFRMGNYYYIRGTVNLFKGSIFIINPKIEKETNTSIMIPRYSTTLGLNNNTIIKTVNTILDTTKIKENIPNSILENNNLISLDQAIRYIHCPKNLEDLNKANLRLKFQELFTYSMKIKLISSYLNSNKNGISFNISKKLIPLKNSLPFQLTKAQNKSIREILEDEKSSNPMNRILQGDVGSGKTIVAIISMFNVATNGYQSALMVPTEILANQHFKEINKYLAAFGIRTSLLTSSTSKKEKNIIKQELKQGTIDIIVGTQALLTENVEFSNLGFVITDEQHRFGVLERTKLINKGENIDVLVMTATPIPRTLSLYIYGDLSLSIIDELPPNRQKIDTYYVTKNKRDRVYNFLLSEIEKGSQGYIVCPLIDDNEDSKLTSVEYLYKELKTTYLKNIDIAILHGKLKSREKEDIFNRFREGTIKVLISTTVIEVGVDVKNATIMIIENAERFGLAQLHQLRGRVGRGDKKSYCILIPEIKSEITKRRMDIIKNNSNGFTIAD
ncbi:MAG: ATP-dependent DNA helicase RecG, partial [Clostridiaceae bacterium]